MSKEYRPFSSETLKDALVLVRQRFNSNQACEITRLALRNPCLSDGDVSGVIGYKAGKPVAFQIQMPRTLYLGQMPLKCLIGAMTCKALKGCPLSILLETIDRSCGNVDGKTVMFGNTCCNVTSTMNCANGSYLGPESCACQRYSIFWRPATFIYAFRRKVLKCSVPQLESSLPVGKEWSIRKNGLDVRRYLQIDEKSLMSFWGRYLKTNQGVVLSRTYEELQWLFGNGIATSRCVFIGASRGGDMIGYIILKSFSDDAQKWKIVDMIAIDNADITIDALLCSSKKFLRQKTPALYLESIGFPTSIQKIIKKHLRFSRPAGGNLFSYSYASKELESKCEEVIKSTKSWFFGPYDGDACMC